MPLVATGTQLLNPEKILIKAGVTQGMKVADLGCGNGYFTLTAAKLVGSQGQVYAVDIMKTALASVSREAERQGIYNIRTVWSNVEIYGATNIPQETLDVCLIVHTLYQVDNGKEFIREADRLVAPGGKIVVIDWEKKKTPIGPPESDRVFEDEVRSIFGQFPQLQELENFSPGKYHFGLIYKKNQ